MLDVNKVLYPTDFSDAAVAAFPTAIRFAALHEARLEAFHAVVLHADETGMEAHHQSLLDDVAAELGRIARETIESMVAGSGAVAGEMVHSQVRAIAAAPAILHRAAECEADVIVMGTHGHRGLRRLIMGSVAEEVVRKSPCPVLTVRTLDSPSPARPIFQRIVVATDFSRAAGVALEHAVELALAARARLDLIHVIATDNFPSFYYPLYSGMLQDLPRLRVEVKERLQDLLDDERLSQIDEARAHVEAGHPSAEITRFAASVHADLIVIASHGRSGLDRVLLGSVAEGVLREAKCAVLVIRGDGKSLLPAASRSRDEVEVPS